MQRRKPPLRPRLTDMAIRATPENESTNHHVRLPHRPVPSPRGGRGGGGAPAARTFTVNNALGKRLGNVRSLTERLEKGGRFLWTGTQKF